jgi:hypothetical protein
MRDLSKLFPKKSDSIIATTTKTKDAKNGVIIGIFKIN